MDNFGGQIWNLCNWRHLVVKFGINMQVAKLATNASGAIWWTNLQPIQEVSLKSISNYSSWEIYSSYGLNALGPLRLWHCFLDLFVCWCYWHLLANLVACLTGPQTTVTIGQQRTLSRRRKLSSIWSILVWHMLPKRWRLVQCLGPLLFGFTILQVMSGRA